jgi:hypothetical protein
VLLNFLALLLEVINSSEIDMIYWLQSWSQSFFFYPISFINTILYVICSSFKKTEMPVKEC